MEEFSLFKTKNEFRGFTKLEEVVFLVIVDVSYSMKRNINEVNEAIKTTIEVLQDLDKEHSIARVKMSIMKFESTTTWAPENPEPIDNYVFLKLSCTEGSTLYNKLYEELDQKLQEGVFLPKKVTKYPVLLLITDGGASCDYKKAYEKIQKNKWFRKAYRYAIPIGNDEIIELYKDDILKFTGSEDRIFKSCNISDLEKIIQIVTVRSIIGHTIVMEDLDDPFIDIKNDINKIRYYDKLRY